MNLLLVGYGKMGQEISKLALSKGFNISGIITDNPKDWTRLPKPENQIAIEFTNPAAAPHNVVRLVELGYPVVCGTTGWWDQLPMISEIVTQHQGALIYGGNFSIGMNVLFQLNEVLANWMNHLSDYDPYILEKHHRHKADAPGGSARQLREQILATSTHKSHAQSEAFRDRPPFPDELSEAWIRAGEIPGIHEVGYASAADLIEIKHTAFNREGFAEGALKAAHWAKNNKGVYNFSELLKKELNFNNSIS